MLLLVDAPFGVLLARLLDGLDPSEILEGVDFSAPEVLRTEVIEIIEAKNAIVFLLGFCCLSCSRRFLVLIFVDFNNFLFLNDFNLRLEDATTSDRFSVLYNYGLLLTAWFIF